MTAELEAIALEQNWSEVYDLAENYRNQEQWHKASIAFNRAIELKPDFFWSYHHLADALSNLKQWQLAVTAYSRAVEIDPNFFWSWHNLGNALINLKRWQPAVTAYSRAVEIDPNFFWSWHNLGNVLINLAQWDRAIACYLQAIQIQPQHKPTYQKLGIAFKQRGSLQASIQSYRQLIQSPPNNSIFEVFKTKPQLLLSLADNLAQADQAIASIVIYYMVLEIEPNHPQVLQQLVQLLQQQNQLQQNTGDRQQRLENEGQSHLLNRQASTTKSTANNMTGQITFEYNCPITPNQLEYLCNTVGWSPRPLKQVKQALEGSFSYVAAWHSHNQEKTLVGFARAVSDGTFYATLLDIVVHPDFQGRGIGKTMVKNLLQQLQLTAIKDITLFASPHLVDFYHQLGFIAQPQQLQWMLWCPNNTNS